MSQEKGERGFIISDKRFSAKKEQAPRTDTDKKTEEPASTTSGRDKAAQESSEGAAGTAEGKEAARKDKAAGDEPSAGKQELPAVSFVSFLLSLSNSALIHLGELQEPGSGKTEVNLPLARQTIDIISMLKEKTRGNLDKEEDMLLDDVLYDLRMRYVKKASP